MEDIISKDDFWKIYKVLPESLKEAIFSADTADAIWNICKLYKVKNVKEIAKSVGNVFLGILPPPYFKDAIKKEAGLDEETAQKVATYIQRYVFDPVKEDLDTLYQEEK